MSSAQVSPIVSMVVGQKPIGIFASVQGIDKSQQEKTGITGTGGQAVATSTIVGHLAEVCAVQGPPRQLTTNSQTPSPSSSVSSSSSPRSNSVNSTTSFIANIANQDSIAAGVAVNPRLTQSPAITNCTTTNVSSYCNTNVGDGRQQSSPIQQRHAQSPAHITNSTNNVANNSTSVSQSSPNTAAAAAAAAVAATAAAVATGTIIVTSTTVRQLSSVDHQIRVLTPSEIMRTLPSLSQEHYDPPPTAIIHTVPVQTPAMVSHLSLCL